MRITGKGHIKQKDKLQKSYLCREWLISHRMHVLVAVIAIILFVLAIMIINLNNPVTQNKSGNNNNDVNHTEQTEDDTSNKSYRAPTKEDNSSKITGKHATNAAKNIKTLGLASKSLNVPLLYQDPILPCGCEAVALTNQLLYYGFDLELTTIVEYYMPFDSEDFVNAYVGDPYSECDGVTIMSPGLTDTANNFLRANSDNFYAYNVSGQNFEELYKYVERGNPVQIWVTQTMVEPDEPESIQDGYPFTIYNHCVLLTGFNCDDGTVELTDSIYGHTEYASEDVEHVWDQLGKQAVVILSKSEIEAYMAGNDASYDDTVASR